MMFWGWFAVILLAYWLAFPPDLTPSLSPPIHHPSTTSRTHSPYPSYTRSMSKVILTGNHRGPSPLRPPFSNPACVTRCNRLSRR